MVIKNRAELRKLYRKKSKSLVVILFFRIFAIGIKMKYTYGKNLICKGADIRIVAATKRIREICGTLE